ncbi:MAG TPA: MoxR family ATPase [Tepidisphaeraceae bacterium]|jgi:MoxR-like ATPase
MSAPPAQIDNTKEVAETCAQLRAELSKTIVGQQRVIEEILICLLAGGHCLVEGVPGLAKTLLVSSLAKAMDLSFARIQFTPDLMPSDISGTDILQEDPETGRRKFEFAKGPIFANLLLADEINRTPPKTQSALLQAMQERQVTIAGRTFELPDPFFVMATRNPIEQEGTYPLPEAQLDRFMFMVLIGYPEKEDELEILRRTTGNSVPAAQAILDAAKIRALQSTVRQVLVGETAYQFALEIIRATRPGEAGAGDFVRHWLAWGAGPRAGQYLILGAKARAILHGRVHVTLEDIQAVAYPVLRHRLIVNFNAQAEGISVEQIIGKVLALIPRNREKML